MVSLDREISKELQKALVQEYMEGSSVWTLQLKYPHLRRRAVYLLIHQAGVMRPRGHSQLGDDPDEAEIERRRNAIRESWTAEQAGKRWVGRSASKMYEMGRSLSQLIPN